MAEQELESAAAASAEEAAYSEPRSILDLQPKMKVRGKVQRLELYGAFIDIGLDIPAILHISKLDRRVNRITDVLSVGDEISVWIDSIDPQRDQITVTMLQPLAVEWNDLKKGQIYSGTVTRLEKFGAFVDIGAEKEGLVHISELSHDYIKHPSEVISQGEEIQTMVLGFNKRKRRIDLSRKAVLELEEAQEEQQESELEEAEEEMPTSMEIAMKKAMDTPTPSKEAVDSSREKSKGRANKDELEDILSRTLKLTKETSD